MMLADLPPSSSVRPTSRPASAAWMSLPTAVEPVKATLSMPSARTSAAPVARSPGRIETTPGGSSASWQISASSSAVSGVVSAGLRIAALPQASAGASPGRHQQREVPGDDLRHHAVRAVLAGPRCRSRSCRPSPRSGRSARRRAGCRCRATRGSACRRPSSPRSPARGRAPASAGRSEQVLAALQAGQGGPLALRRAGDLDRVRDVLLAGDGDRGDAPPSRG